MISRVSESSTSDPLPSTEMRSCTLPGAASNVTREGPRGAAAGDDPSAAAEREPADASATSGTRPRKTGDPSVPTAINETRDGSPPRAAGASPGVFGAGSHTNVTRVLPFSPRDVPIQVRTTDAREGRLTAASASSTAFGGPGLGGAIAFAVSVGVNAQ